MSGLATRALALAFPLALLAGCGPRAIFELELELPPSPPGGPRFAVVEASVEASVEESPEGSAEEATLLEGIPLTTACARAEPAPPCALRTLDPTCGHVVSVLAGSAPLERPLAIRVRFCADAACAGETDAPSTLLEVERAFYEGRYTQARACIDELPTSPAPPPIPVARCEVQCREGTSANSCRLDGTHFCE